MISEEEMDSEAITPELLPSQRFEVMVKEASLDESRANYLLQNFSGHFKEAAEWAKKAKDIIVTNENQTVMMQMARTGRLFLSKKRQEIEKARKWMKEPALREGQAIDKIANLLKDTIIPTEEHLFRQENFIKLKKDAEDARLLEEARIREEERVASEMLSQAAERDRLRIENEKLRKEAEEKERINQEELKRVREKNEEILRIERDRNAVMERELLNKKQAELKAEADKIRAEESLLSADDQTKMIAFRRSVEAIKIPDVKSAINKRIIEDVKSYLYLAVSKINVIQEEE